MSSVANPKKSSLNIQVLLKVNVMWGKVALLLSFFYFHGSQFKNKNNGKVEKEKFSVPQVASTLHLRPSFPNFGSQFLFSGNFHPKQQGSCLTPGALCTFFLFQETDVAFHTGVRQLRIRIT